MKWPVKMPLGSSEGPTWVLPGLEPPAGLEVPPQKDVNGRL